MIRRLSVILFLLVTLLGAFTVFAQTTPTEVEAALADLNARLGTAYAITDVDNWTWAEQQFSDASLGCPQPDAMYAQVLTRGYIITFTVQDQVYDYRAANGQVTLCSVTPIAAATETPPAVGGEWSYTVVAGDFNPYLAWSPSGEFIAVSGVVDDAASANRGMILLYDPDDLEAPPQQVPLNQPVTALEYIAADPVIYLATGGGSGDVSLFPVEPAGFDVLTMETTDTSTVGAVAISPDRQLIASVNSAQNDPALRELWAIHLWNASDGSLSADLDVTAPVTALDFAPNSSSMLAVGLLGGGFALYAVEDGEPLSSVEVSADADVSTLPTLVRFNPDGAWLAVAHDLTVTLWDVSDPANPVEGLTFTTDAPIRALDFSPDGAFLAVAGGDPALPDAATSAIRVWETATGTLAATLRGHTDAVNSLAFSPSGTRLASVSFDGTLRVWEFNIAVG